MALCKTLELLDYNAKNNLNSQNKEERFICDSEAFTNKTSVCPRIYGYL